MKTIITDRPEAGKQYALTGATGAKAISSEVPDPYTTRNIIEYYVKSVYGIEREYISSPKIAASVKMISNQKCLTPETKVGLLALGFNFMQVLPPTNK